MDEAKQSLEAANAALEAAEEDLSGWLRAAATEALTQTQRTRDRAVIGVENEAEELAQAQAQVNPGQSGDTGSDTLPEGQTPLIYDTAEEFLHEQLLPLYNRIIDSRNGKWCSAWFLHAEAVSRRETLWRAWEHLRLDTTTGMSVWWKDHADVHMAVLLSQKGPFHRCDPDRHRTPEPLPCKMAPEGWFEKASEVPDA
ncbi:DUF4913 domain-containing protein [Arthrobacter rhombi]|uniref:DUF4913 domain-containing protein n=1 Tax=Arthrobacter rhombi TaxID=71253 RepID=UPI003FD05AFA